MEKVDSKIVNKNKSGLLEINFDKRPAIKFKDLIKADSKFLQYSGKGKDNLKKENKTEFKAINESAELENQSNTSLKGEIPLNKIKGEERTAITQSEDENIEQNEEVVENTEETTDDTQNMIGIAKEYNLIPDNSVSSEPENLENDDNDEFTEEIEDEDKLHESLIYTQFLNWKQEELQNFFESAHLTSMKNNIK